MKVPLLALCLLGIAASPAMSQRAKCGAAEPDMSLVRDQLEALADCGYLTNSPQPEYEPSFYYAIPVVFHVIMNNSGDGFLSEDTIQDQIDVLNEDLQALPGSPGAPGNNAEILFYLATEDPNGTPTNGITYTTNNSWYNDSGNYWTSLHWDTTRYLNVYTNSPPCCFGYVQDFPSNGVAGDADDRVVLWWEAVGKEPTSGWPLNMGRTGTHEVGHYLGLYHTFCGGCGSAVNCDSTGDLICDTNGQASDTSGCPGTSTSCGNSDPIHNYMDYSDDHCLWEFTPEQVNRMRCTLENWRIDVRERVDLGLHVNSNTVEDGDTLSVITRGGAPGALGMLVAVNVNGTPTFIRLDVGPFDVLGRRTFAGPVSSALAGLVLTFQTFGYRELGGKLGFSNRGKITFQ